MVDTKLLTYCFHTFGSDLSKPNFEVDTAYTRVSAAGYHGQGGPLKVASHKTIGLTDLWLQAGKEMGLKEVDPNGETVEGTSVFC